MKGEWRGGEEGSFLQVLRKTRLRGQLVGTELSLDEKADWQDLQNKAVKRRAPGSGEAAAKRARSDSKYPRLATYDWLCGLDSAIRDGVGHGLEWYRAKDPARAYDDDMMEGELDDECGLTICVDEEQKQLAGYYYLERKANLVVFRLQPPLHRRHNDMMTALAKSGLYDVVALTIFQRNIAFGPWKKSGNMQELWEAGVDMMVTLKTDDIFLMKLWPGICRDHGWESEEETGREARKTFIATLPSYRPFSVKGPKAAYSKWMSVIKAIDYEVQDATTKALGIAFLALRKGWVQHLDDLWRPRDSLLEQQQRGMSKFLPKVGSGGADAKAAPGAASSSGLGGAKMPEKGKPPGKAKAKAKASASVSGLLKKNVNALASVGKLLGNLEFRSLQEVIRVVCGPLSREHSHTATIMHTRHSGTNQILPNAHMRRMISM